MAAIDRLSLVWLYLLVLGTDVSSGRTEAGMRRLKPQPLMAVASQCRGGAAHIVSAWHPRWSSCNSTAATMRRCSAAAKPLASSDCGCTSLMWRAAAGQHCAPLPVYLQSFSLLRLRDAATLHLSKFSVRAEACLALKDTFETSLNYKAVQ